MMRISFNFRSGERADKPTGFTDFNITQSQGNLLLVCRSQGELEYMICAQRTVQTQEKSMVVVAKRTSDLNSLLGSNDVPVNQAANLLIQYRD